MPHLFYVLYLNSKGKFEKAKVVFLVMNIIVIGAVSLLIRGDGVEYNLMVTIFLAPFLFSKKRTLFLFLAASSLMFIGVRYLAMVLPETDIYDASHKLVSSISLLLAVISTLFLIIVFQRFRIKVSKALIAKNELIKEKLTESTQNYRSLFENMIEGFAYCEMVFENDRPTDFIYLDVNAAFEKQTGLKDVIGKKISEVVPSAKGSNTALFKIYERVVASGNPERSEMYSPELEGWYDISAYCPKTGYLVLVFDQITERKAAEINLQKAFKEVAAYKYALNEAAIVAFTDQNGIIDEVNENFCKISGFTESELIGENHRIINSDFRDLSGSSSGSSESDWVYEDLLPNKI
jgi:PAS domain-containing protein